MTRSAERSYEGERFILYSYFFLTVGTKELATGESLMKQFHCIPNEDLFEDRLAKAVKITRKNKKRLLEDEKDPLPTELFKDLDEGMIKRFEWVERSW